ncbi:transposase [Rhodococcus ruber Chol-4]|uniref:Transposase n=4 Tax=Nocardiaceae TaxID=85025 RepID=A0A098BJ70_9NOCA|nr:MULTISPECIES: transposase [Rhodococcus]AUM16308.1 DDE transposase [Rhodococcus ruber]AUM16657.1 DDE transposase [Rhodococcus ruber]AUM18455.1 DDE transposase [Rhodococcus ruber]AUM18476.1 DDE transposase [Rhodococcus ruber]AUM18522.1 DDE transposase [Rhodococcus ruber]
MAKGYRPVDRDQQFLIPPDMRDWLGTDHPVWTVIDIIDRIDTTAFHRTAKTGGAGRAGYHPDMLLTLLVWAWSRGERSSRRIERLCTEDVAYRVICAQDIPDHVTIARFRKTHATACEDLFTQVLLLAAALGLGRLETIALDSVKIASNASAGANRTESSVRAEAAAHARAVAAAAVAAHAATDAAEDEPHDHGDRGPGSVPPALTDPRSRAARISEAIAALDAARAADEQARADKDTSARLYLEQARGGQMPMGAPPASAAVAAAELALEKTLAAHAAKVRRYEQRRAEAAAKGHRYGGWVIRPAGQDPKVIKARARLARATAAAAAATAVAAARADADTEGRPERVVNTTDPESGLQPLRGGGWVQGFNCQAVTSGDGLIMAVSVAANPTDAPTFVPMMQAAVAAAGSIIAARPTGTADTDGTDGTDGEGIGMLLADAGYFSEANITAPGPDRLIARGKARHLEHAARHTPVSGPAPVEASPVEVMAHRLRTEEGIATYRKRSHIAETPFGHAKHNLNFRRFTGRGLVRARGEWSFHAAVHNIGKILAAVGGGGLPAAV